MVHVKGFLNGIGFYYDHSEVRLQPLRPFRAWDFKLIKRVEVLIDIILEFIELLYQYPITYEQVIDTIMWPPKSQNLKLIFFLIHNPENLYSVTHAAKIF